MLLCGDRKLSRSGKEEQYQQPPSAPLSESVESNEIVHVRLNGLSVWAESVDFLLETERALDLPLPLLL